MQLMESARRETNPWREWLSSLFKCVDQLMVTIESRDGFRYWKATKEEGESCSVLFTAATTTCSTSVQYWKMLWHIALVM